MDSIKFEWDENKNEINKKKHKISFEEAQTVFYDENALVIDDPEHSAEEERFIILGFSKKANLLVVCHCYRESDSIIRLFESYPQEKPQKPNAANTRNEVKQNEIGIRFFKREKNPYISKLKKQITINIDSDVISYFKRQSEFSGIPYQTLINLYLSDCVNNKKTLNISWN